jgi:hypothetical protein
MNDVTHKQSQQPAELEQECCELYAEYCYPCRSPEPKQGGVQKRTSKRSR